MTRGFISFECISDKEVSEILKEFSGVDMVYTLSKGSYNTLAIYGNIIPEYRDCVDNELWEGEKIYENLKAQFEEKFGSESQRILEMNGGDWM